MIWWLFWAGCFITGLIFFLFGRMVGYNAGLDAAHNIWKDEMRRTGKRADDIWKETNQ